MGWGLPPCRPGRGVDVSAGLPAVRPVPESYSWGLARLPGVGASTSVQGPLSLLDPLINVGGTEGRQEVLSCKAPGTFSCFGPRAFLISNGYIPIVHLFKAF